MNAKSCVENKADDYCMVMTRIYAQADENQAIVKYCMPFLTMHCHCKEPMESQADV